MTVLEYDSPSGTITTTKLIPPFAPVQRGFGFVGVVAEDTGTGKIQCHLCGKWFEQLAAHLHGHHRMSSDEYKKTFGLFKATALASQRLRVHRSAVMIGNRNRNPENRHAFSAQHPVHHRRTGKEPAERQNRAGTCELQVADRIKQLAEKVGRTPTLVEVAGEYGKGFTSTIRNRYGGYLKLLRTLGYTPVASSLNPKYSHEFFVERGVKAAGEGKLLFAKELFSANEHRRMHKYFGSNDAWLIAVYRRLQSRAGISNEKLRTGTKRLCEECRSPMYVQPYLQKKGFGRFCSKECAYKGRITAKKANRKQMRVKARKLIA
jgi:hypothetical protein